MLAMEPYFTESVGVAPGTTTMALGGLGYRGDPDEGGALYGLDCAGCSPTLGNCPPDEPWYYTQPPVVDVGYPSGLGPPPPPTTGSGSSGAIQVTQTSATAPSAMAPAPGSAMPGAAGHWHPLRNWNVYATESKLRGLGGSGMPTWSIFALIGVAIAGAIGVAVTVKHLQRFR